MAVLLALGCAVTYGIADFLGGIASRRAAVWSVVIAGQVAGLVVLAAAVPFLPDATVTTSDLIWGGAGGLAGALALTQFFRALATGAMAAVAPVAAVVNVSVPVVAGIALGERPATVAWFGIVLGVPAIALVSRERHDEATRTPPSAILAALVAGLGFGMFFTFLDRTGDGAGIAPLIAARVVSVSVLVAAGAATNRIGPLDRRTGRIALSSGVLDMTANVLFLYAVREGLLALGSVVSAMYPASTIVLARVVLGERLQRTQIGGLALAAAAVGLVAVA